MRSFAIASSIAAVAYASPSVETKFEEFIQKFERKYTDNEKAHRLKIFKDNMAMIEASNSQNKSYTLGVTPHTDLTLEEFKAQFVGGFIPMKAENMTMFEKPVGVDPPDSVDWVKDGAVTSVKNQGNCGSCWTFSATGALEGAMKVAGRDLVELSQQMLVSCDTGLLGGHGCSGGNPAQAFGWVKSNGMCSSADYSYKCVDAKADACTSAKCGKDTCTPVLKKGGFFHKGDVTAYGSVGQSEGELEAAVARQPISVAIQADTAVFQHYTSGVLDDAACGQQLDHGVLAVGYGTDSGHKYWKIKNSWGPTWGDSGYIRILKGSTEKYGECGIREMASYPTVAPKPASEIVV